MEENGFMMRSENEARHSAPHTSKPSLSQRHGKRKGGKEKGERKINQNKQTRESASGSLVTECRQLPWVSSLKPRKTPCLHPSCA